MASHDYFSGSSPLAGSWNNAQQQARPDWQRTPHWMFWRPAWRIQMAYINGRITWKYQTHRQRARAVLEQQFNSGGHSEGQGNETPQQGQRPGFKRAYGGRAGRTI